ncbi:hypothetical protein GALL_115220 [mine drainage metagenome]|uniref:Uncharacterized protein n=1 Tax=mine drainage metagenome TaxID=410659 RepID=A0A1J5SXK8_9ZZZZ
MNPNDEQKLETLIHQTLRSLPERQAPRTLELRVLNSIAARRTLPWWRQSYTHWPMPARLGFAGASVALAAAILVYGSLGVAGLARMFGALCSCVLPLKAVLGAAGSFGHLATTLFDRIPALYLYGGLGAIVLFYVALFGLGTTAYRAFIANR